MVFQDNKVPNPKHQISNNIQTQNANYRNIPVIKPATKFVIPAAAERRAGIQIWCWIYWIPAFAGMTA